MITWICFLVTFGVAESSRILAFFPMPTPSHQFIFRPVLEGLAKNSHEIVFMTGYPYKEVPKNITQIDLSKYDMFQELGVVDFTVVSEMNLLEYAEEMYHLGEVMCRHYVGSKEVQDLIHSDQKFDAVMFESYFYQEYLSAFLHKFNAIGIEVMTVGDTVWVNEMSGLQDNPSYQLDFKSGLTADMNFWQKLYNVYVHAFTIVSSYYYLHHYQQPLMDKYFNYTGWESRPSIDVLARNRSLILTNFDYVYGYPYPTAPNRKDIGGINIQPRKPLPEDLQTFMDESKDGVIYMSLGSHIDPSKFRKQISAFLEVFRDLPQRVMLKYDPEESSEIPPNVKVSKWFPQQDILAHKNCVLFITHGGLLSTSEAIYFGVPLVGIPIISDQFKNLATVESKGFGRMLKLKNITRDTVSWTVREVLSNKRYKEEVLRISALLTDKRHTPVEEAVYWVEYVLKYPFALIPKSANLSFFEFHLIDVKIFLMSVLVLMSYLIYSVFKITKNVLYRAIIKPKEKVQL